MTSPSPIARRVDERSTPGRRPPAPARRAAPWAGRRVGLGEGGGREQGQVPRYGGRVSPSGSRMDRQSMKASGTAITASHPKARARPPARGIGQERRGGAVGHGSHGQRGRPDRHRAGGTTAGLGRRPGTGARPGHPPARAARAVGSATPSSAASSPEAAPRGTATGHQRIGDATVTADASRRDRRRDPRARVAPFGRGTTPHERRTQTGRRLSRLAPRTSRRHANRPSAAGSRSAGQRKRRRGGRRGGRATVTPDPASAGGDLARGPDRPRRAPAARCPRSRRAPGPPRRSRRRRPARAPRPGRPGGSWPGWAGRRARQQVSDSAPVKAGTASRPSSPTSLGRAISLSFSCCSPCSPDLRLGQQGHHGHQQPGPAQRGHHLAGLRRTGGEGRERGRHGASAPPSSSGTSGCGMLGTSLPRSEA